MLGGNQSSGSNVTLWWAGCVDPGSLQVPLALLYSLVFVVGLAGNLLALWVFFCLPSRRKTSVRVFLVNVALADLLLVACLPFRVLYHAQGDVWSLHPLVCRVVGNLFYMNMYISVTLLGLISIDRYLKIHRRSAAARHPLTSIRWSSTICTAVWAVSFTLILVLLTSNSHKQHNRCFHYKLLHSSPWKAYVNVAVVLLFWLLFFCLAASYGRIAVKLWRASRAQPELPNAARYARTARKSFFILFLFSVCFVPYHLVRPFYIATQLSDSASCYWRGVADRANEAALLLSATNSCLDPVMYFLLSSSVRKEVLRLASTSFCTWGRREGGGVSGSSSTPHVEGGGRS